ncbi:MAG: TrkH family potassium uptake protein [Lachnospira sp.]
MNKSIVRNTLGKVLMLEGILMLVPAFVGLIYREKAGWTFVITSVICIAVGIVMNIRKAKDSMFYLKEGCVITALSWIFISLFGCIPFVMSGEIPKFTDALFETVSGFTTTGASILSDVESLSHCMLFWRSFTHWIGGMGVLVFLMAVIPLTGGANINIMKAESPGPSVGKLVPKMEYTARLLYIIYFGMTMLEIIFLLIGKMPAFDAVTTALGTAGTGGFGIKNNSMMGYSPYLQWVVTIFMILFGVNFNVYFLLLYRNFKKAFQIEEVKCYFGIMAVGTAIIFVNIYKIFGSFESTLRHSLFQVATVMTTTGFSSADFDLWPETARAVLVILMFVGACAGSTGGGIKVSRFMILFKSVLKELNSYIHPKSVKTIRVEGKPVEHETVRSVNVFFITFTFIFTLSFLILSFEGKDMITNFTAVTATMNNIGPGLELVGPTQNFSSFSFLSKYVLIFDMLAGRLELFPMLLLLNPVTWKEMLFKRRKAG